MAQTPKDRLRFSIHINQDVGTVSHLLSTSGILWNFAVEMFRKIVKTAQEGALASDKAVK